MSNQQMPVYLVDRSIDKESDQEQRARDNALVRLARGGCEASRNRLIKRHARAAFRCAANYANKNIEIDDLFAESLRGLNHAIDKFDDGSGNKFLTYAIWWMKAAVSKHVDSNRTIRVPANYRLAIRRIKIKIEAGQELTTKEAASLEWYRNSEVSNISAAITSGVGESVSSGRTVEDFIADESPLADDTLQDSEMGRALRNAMQELPERARRILAMRYGLDHGDNVPFREIGEVVGLSRQGVLNDEIKYLRILRGKLAKFR